MSIPVKLDKIDRKILEILQANAKITNSQLSKEIGLSPAPTLERVKKLEQSGVIHSYHAQLNPSKIGLGVNTFVLVSLTGHNKDIIEIFIEEINKIDEVIECHHITGSGDFILKIITGDIAAYQQLMLERVSAIKVVDNLQSMVILSTFKDSKVMPVPDGILK
ncbi:Lrp/AsnC family transcriptional regulator [Mangrovivirga sp. M17]|uniref:AsnC family transcriptional regulator n=2 Tax=Mangrovivirga TaxID=2858886 RepID=A0A4D7K6W8_9BACT|nr:MULTISPECIES: Lrp/AsnC family transcriptional regulator [Mangrovivirga]MCX2743402.1 Lrp/AsnC family transcriptional regulator [Mangrovivirga halotolerans]QCK16484.1 AsnC family transcriptional regulator [Mangrovivirga cuniculi]